MTQSSQKTLKFQKTLFISKKLRKLVEKSSKTETFWYHLEILGFPSKHTTLIRRLVSVQKTLNGRLVLTGLYQSGGSRSVAKPLQESILIAFLMESIVLQWKFCLQIYLCFYGQ